MRVFSTRTLLCAALGLAYVPAASAAKEDFKEWTVDIRFINASKVVSEDTLDEKIRTWVAVAEQVYRRRPALKIRYTVVRQTAKDGRSLSRLVFDSAAAYTRYMEQNFDTVAVTRTEGHLPMLILDDLCVGTLPGSKKPRCDIGGRAFFPHWTAPFGRKYGVTLIASHGSKHLLAHELGHVFGLKHTFEPYVGFNAQCNDDYRPKGKPEGMCNSCERGRITYDENNDPDECAGPVNIMDYCWNEKGNEFLNTCQEQRAANQRYTYMTADGKTNYFRLKGLAGEAVCDSDSDCEDGRYCDKGTVGVGRNQCKPVKAVGTVCTRGEECLTGRCAGLKCAAADECTADRDCGGGRYCNQGLAGLGRNTCEALLADSRACTGDHQCGSGECSGWRPQDGQASGICFTPASKAAGASCQIDLECRTGKCNSSKQCVCARDADCGPGRWCDGGVDTKQNTCKEKLAKGEVCGTVGEMSVGHRCKSGDCKVSGLSAKLECQ